MFTFSFLMIAASLGIVGSGGYIYYVSHIEETPITKRKRFMVLTENQILEIADYEFKQVGLCSMLILQKIKLIIFPIGNPMAVVGAVAPRSERPILQQFV